MNGNLTMSSPIGLGPDEADDAGKQDDAANG